MIKNVTPSINGRKEQTASHSGAMIDLSSMSHRNKRGRLACLSSFCAQFGVESEAENGDKAQVSSAACTVAGGGGEVVRR